MAHSPSSRSLPPVQNALLMDTGPRPRLCICDFGYTKSQVLHSAFHTTNVGTPSYLAPELLTLGQGQNYGARGEGMLGG